VAPSPLVLMSIDWLRTGCLDRGLLARDRAKAVISIIEGVE
jgi:hypothetical protein